MRTTWTMPTLGLLTAMAAVPATAAADPGAPISVAARVQLKVDGTHNPLTNSLGYLMSELEGGYDVRPWLTLHGSAGIGKVYGDETEGHGVALLAGATAHVVTGPVRLGLRLDAGYAWTVIDFKGQAARFGGVLIEPGVELGHVVGAHGSLSVLVGPRFRAVSDDGGGEERWNSGWHVGVMYARSL